MKRRSKILWVAAGATAASLVGQTAAHAADYTWSSLAAGTYNWTDPANWGGSGPPTLAGDTANMAVGLLGNVNANVTGAITIGALSLGGTGAAVTTDVGNANLNGGTFTFDNTGGPNNSDGNANASITSNGVLGSTNLITAGVFMPANLSITQASNNSLSISSLTISGGPGAFTRNLVNNLTGNTTLTLGGITSVATGVATQSITNELAIQTANNSTTTSWGTVHITGPVTNGAQNGTFNVSTRLIFGTAGANNANTIGTIIVSGNNTHGGGARLFRVNLVLDSDTALGSGGFQHGSGAGAGAMGFNLFSTSDARTIANNFLMQRNVTFKGDNSITWNGSITQSNASTLANLLATGKTLTLNGNVFSDNGATARTLTFDGPGLTVVNGALGAGTGDIGGAGRYIKVGSGILTSNGLNTYSGITFVAGGLWQYGNVGAGTSTNGVTSMEGSAVGALDNSTGALLEKIKASGVASTGGLALTNADSAGVFDYTGSGTMSHSNTLGMSLGAVAAGATFGGTITPAPAGYRLGGGGTLTLVNANALTGAANLTVANGGTVELAAANNYSGTTTVKGQYIVSLQQAAAANNGNLITPGVFVAPTLSIADTAALGTAANDAANLNLSGGTLKYTGAGGTTNRLFTITPVGATLDASGTGSVNFANAGAIVSADVQGPITGSETTGNTINSVNDISQLAVGMTITGTNLPAGTTITGFQPVVATSSNVPTGLEYRIRTSANGTLATTGTALTFGNQNRTLTLTGSNAADNTVAGVLSDSAAGKLAVAKTGTGKWVLGGANTYTGGTSVSSGTLVVNTKIPNGPVTISGGTLAVASKGTPNTPSGTSVIPSLTITGATLDLGNNSMVIDYAAVGPNPTLAAEIREHLRLGRILSSAQTSTRRLGYADNASFGTPKTTFGGVTVDADMLLIKYTTAGDADLDGDTDGGDIGTWATNFTGSLSPGSGVKVWNQGDWDYDSDVDGADAALWASAFTGSLSPGLGPVVEINGAIDPAALSVLQGLGVTVVPEPASLALAGLAAAWSLQRPRSRRSRRRA